MSYRKTVWLRGLLGWWLIAAAAHAQTVLFTIPGTPSGDGFGGAVSNVGDVNGDGRADVLVGNAWDDAYGTNAGTATVYSGKDQSVLHAFHGDAAGDYFGFAVSGAGDVNADGVPDFVVGATRYVDFLQTGVGYARVFSGKDGSVLYTFSEGADDDYGASVSGAGDTGADGYDDVLVGAWWGNGNGSTDAGRVYLYSGRTGALLFTFAGDQHLDYVGIALGGAGDLNGDASTTSWWAAGART
ncbi:MAG: integrin alpha [Planctomycetota bacterium]